MARKDPVWEGAKILRGTAEFRTIPAWRAGSLCSPKDQGKHENLADHAADAFLGRLVLLLSVHGRTMQQVSPGRGTLVVALSAAIRRVANTESASRQSGRNLCRPCGFFAGTEGVIACSPSALEQTVDQLRTELIKLRRQLNGKEQYIGRLQFLVQQRSNVIDDQRGKLEQSQAQIRQLNDEADHLAELVRMS